MTVNSINSFENGFKYKLYRTVYEIVHPTISKKNISGYRIVFNDDILPVRVFYPKKVSNINRIIFYIPGVGSITDCSGSYAKISKNIALRMDTLVIAIDMDDNSNCFYSDMRDLVSKTCFYLYDELIKLDILDLDIILLGDSIGATMALEIAKNERFFNSKLVLFYPVLSSYFNSDIKYDLVKKVNKYFESYTSNMKLLDGNSSLDIIDTSYKYKSNILFILGDADPLKDDIVSYYDNCYEYNNQNKIFIINKYGHGFLNCLDEIALNDMFKTINEFIVV